MKENLIAKSATKTTVERGHIDTKKGWVFSVYFHNRPYPNFISGLYTTKSKATKALNKYLKTGLFDWYGDAE